MGSTQFKRYLSCEARAVALLKGDWREETSTAMLVGSYVDAHFGGALDIFRAQHPDIFTRAGTLKSEYQHAEYIIQRIERDEAMMRALSGRQQVIMTGEIEGVPVKVKIDSLLPDRTVDQKIMRDMQDVWIPGEGRKSFVEAWGYDIQGAMYQEIRAQNDGGERKPFDLAIATKEKPEPDIAILTLPQDMLDNAMGVVRANIVHFDSLKKGLYPPERCEKCSYCRATKILTGPVDYRLAMGMEE